MAKKINGYARDNYGVIEFVELGKPEEGAWHEATLVVGKERVFTETEVRAMLMDMRAWLDCDDWKEGNRWAQRATKHGITLPDPL